MRALAIDDTVVVPLPVDVIWADLTDPLRLAACVPGLTAADGAGRRQTRWRLRLGDRTVTYGGTGTAESGPAPHRVRWHLTGRELRGGGTATADLELSLRARGTSTVVTVRVTIQGTGAIAALDPATAATTVHRLALATRRAALRTAAGAAAAPPAPTPPPAPALEIVPPAPPGDQRRWRRLVAWARPPRPAILVAGSAAAAVLVTAAVHRLGWWRGGRWRRR